jgi:nucleoside-diphosphate-sugar epimerase
MPLHTILGAGGSIGNSLTKVLLAAQESVRLVSRRASLMSNCESHAADLLNYQQTLQAVRGSSFVYLLAGLKYDRNIWKECWPKIMTNAINACKATGVPLIFFDNVYMYGRVAQPMTEETSFNPCSAKGEIRAKIAQQLIDEMNAGNLRAMIARSADFYGTANVKTSVPNMLVFDNLRKGKKAQWLVNADVPHSFTYIPDAGSALYLLTSTESAFGQTWHMPTAPNPLTGREFVREAATAMNAQNRLTVLSKFLINIGGLFDSDIRESKEMLYQSEHPYVVDSSKFNNAFNFKPTTYIDGIRETAEQFLAAKAITPGAV